VGKDENVPALWAEIDELRADNGRLREALECVTSALEDAVAHADNRGQGGMQVPFHGDFAAATQLPSFVSRARWHARQGRAALDEKEKS